MAFCTIVEFDWSDDFDVGRPGDRGVAIHRGRQGLRRAERGKLARMPAPSRVLGFEVTSDVLR